MLTTKPYRPELGMQDTFKWTDELVQEFVQFTLHNSPVFQGRYKDMEQFKSSKSPKKEWEIMAFGEHFDGRIVQYKLLQSGFYRNVDDDCEIEYAADQFKNENEFIHSVRRLSDDWTVSVKDKVKTVSGKIGTIQAINADGHILLSDITGLEHITTIQKLPQPVLTTVDQQDLFSRQDEVWVVNKDNEIIHRYVDTILDHGYAFQDCRFYSTPEAARDYVLNHAPVLSLNDVKEVIGKNSMQKSDEILLSLLTTLVKQKLNQ